MAAYRRVYGFGHLRADCRGPGSAPESYARFEYGTTSTFTRAYFIRRTTHDRIFKIVASSSSSWPAAAAAVDSVDVCWRQRDGIDVTDDSRVSVTSDSSGASKLTIRDAKPSDSGLYSCLAKNPHGFCKTAATVRVAGNRSVFLSLVFLIIPSPVWSTFWSSHDLASDIHLCMHRTYTVLFCRLSLVLLLF